jgi:hypothetical protein
MDVRASLSESLSIGETSCHPCREGMDVEKSRNAGRLASLHASLGLDDPQAQRTLRTVIDREVRLLWMASRTCAVSVNNAGRFRAMVGDAPVPGWLATDGLLAQFGRRRNEARAQILADG